MKEWEVPNNIDPECRELCIALNKVPGIHTTESCCGHNKDHYMIWLEADNVAALNKFLWAGCFRWWCWRGNWQPILETADPNRDATTITICLESIELGEQAYEQADIMAKGITKFVSEYFL